MTIAVCESESWKERLLPLTNLPPQEMTINTSIHQPPGELDFSNPPDKEMEGMALIWRRTKLK